MDEDSLRAATDLTKAATGFVETLGNNIVVLIFVAAIIFFVIVFFACKMFIDNNRENKYVHLTERCADNFITISKSISIIESDIKSIYRYVTSRKP